MRENQDNKELRRTNPLDMLLKKRDPEGRFYLFLKKCIMLGIIFFIGLGWNVFFFFKRYIIKVISPSSSQVNSVQRPYHPSRRCCH